MSDALRIIVVLGLIGLNAFFVIGEYAVVTARRSALATRAAGGSRRARAALKLMDDPVRVISTTQVGITALGILTGAVSEPLVRRLLGDWIPTWLSVVLAFTIITYLSVVLGELVPKALTLDRAETLAMLVAAPIQAISVAFAPMVVVLQRSAAVLLRPLGIREIHAGEGIRTADELRALVDEAEGAGVIPRAQEELLHNVFDFADREARDIMVPAVDVDWIDCELTCDAALDTVVEAPHSRYPAGRGSIDRIVGTVHVYDLVAAARRAPETRVWEVARPPLIVPESKDVGALLRELREQRQQLAIVADEYGMTAGIVTLEDVTEELVGEIEDEYDLPDSTLRWIDDHTVEAAGSMSIDDFNEAVGTELPTGPSRTLAGLVFDALGRRPQVGDEAVVDGVRLRVEELDSLRITRLRITLPAEVAAGRAER
ncbi:MAG TPA: hemolysin family protein [Baekduia sp.]|uniref:hemolysin family protein n=1 Tax=Baekduia sp. TaxID=2600305 RepID=UPI002B8FAFFE|nr:hemolysin family protein [Baekduia sp.]HMJ34210.1 hemolysin family protein [Baekduia sp.]